MWEAGARALGEGWRQGQEFWNNVARNWADAAQAWLGQLPRSGQGVPVETLAVWRELHEAAFAAGQAWMRLPMALASGGSPAELQEAVIRLTEAQGRAYRIWTEAIQKMGEAARPGSGARPS
jgi:hypothetical protein